MGVPRVPAEIVGGDRGDVLGGKAKVINMNNVDFTQQFLNGALITLAIARSVGAFEALLIEKSPSCGCGEIFDGKFQNKFKGRRRGNLSTTEAQRHQSDMHKSQTLLVVSFFRS